MNTILNEATTTIIINKSTFTTHIKQVTTLEAAKGYINEIRKQYPNATHHVSAYTIGKTGEYGHYCDDGEPSGTAGLPVLDVFRKNAITNFVCVVTRYFGGIKLGAGGLVRAYSKAASETLKQMEIIPIINYQTLQLVFHYSYFDLIENRLQRYSILNRSFDQNVKLFIQIPETQLKQVITEITQITNNQCQMRIVENCQTVEEI